MIYVTKHIDSAMDAQTGRRSEPIEITPEMIEAGVGYIDSSRALIEPTPSSDEEVADLVTNLFRIMALAGDAPKRRF